MIILLLFQKFPCEGASVRLVNAWCEWLETSCVFQAKSETKQGTTCCRFKDKNDQKGNQGIIVNSELLVFSHFPLSHSSHIWDEWNWTCGMPLHRPRHCGSWSQQWASQLSERHRG